MNAPSTLPADFGEWDSGGDVSATQPAVPPPARVAVSPVVERMPAPVSRASTANYAEAAQVFHPQQPKSVRAGGEKHRDESNGKKNGLVPLIAVGSLTLLIIFGGVSYIKMKSGAAVPKPVAAPQTTVTNTPPPVPTNLPVTPAPAPATTGSEDRQRTQSDLMNRQLNAPSRIPNDLKMLAGREPPPSSGFAAASMDSLGGSVFSGGQSGPRVKIAAPSKISISAGVAGGLLLQKTSPVYPQIAREARVSGTVVIQATISKTGALENLRVVSGPTMLRQSALDAVKTWRYKPYLLDGQPVDVETTVSVNFSLGG
ncbi:MAG: TonB family protein [Terracidiphilus sp.]